MIKVHVYCSYKLSSSGFQYGVFEYLPYEDKKSYLLSDEKKLPIISSSFNYGIVKRVIGKLPNEKKYIFLFKKLSYVYDKEHEDVGGDVMMNMAFEFDKFKEFSLFVSSFESEEKNNKEKLAEELADCIQPDISIETYKLSINKTKFDIWLQEKLSGKENDNHKRYNDKILIFTNSKETDYKAELQNDIYRFPETNNDGNIIGIDNYKEKKDCYYYPAKKNGKQINYLIKCVIIFITIILLILIVTRSCGKQKNKIEDKLNSELVFKLIPYYELYNIKKSTDNEFDISIKGFDMSAL